MGIVIRGLEFSYKKNGGDISGSIGSSIGGKNGGKTSIVNLLSMDLPCEGIVAFMGPSGCGKTTLMNLIAGLVRPGGGEILMPARFLPQSKKRLTARNPKPVTSYVFQDPRLLPWLDAAANVEVVIGKNAERSPRETAEYWLGRVGLDRAAWGKFPRELSGGMRHRVSIARALAYDAPLFLLDEPFLALDRELRGGIMELISGAAACRKLIIFITHDPEEAAVLADRVIIFGGSPLCDYRDVKISDPRGKRDTGAIRELIMKG